MQVANIIFCIDINQMYKTNNINMYFIFIFLFSYLHFDKIHKLLVIATFNEVEVTERIPLLQNLTTYRIVRLCNKGR